MESQELKEFSFCIISRKTNDKIKKKKYKYPIFGPLLPKFV